MRPLDAVAAWCYAAAYDATVSHFGPYERLVEDIARLIDRGVGGRRARVLDVACGTGTLARRLARSGHEVTGIDAVPGLVEAARRRTPTALADRLTFSARDAALEGPSATGVFDAVVVLHALYWHPKPERLLDACRRALRPGGHAIVVSYRRAATVGGVLASVRRTEGLLAAASALRWLVPTAAFEALRRVPKRYLDEAGVTQLLARSGFVVRETRNTFLGGVSVMAWAQPNAVLDEDDATGASSRAFHPSLSGRC